MKIGRLFWAVFIGLALSQTMAAGALPNSGDEQDVAEAVFRYELRQLSSGNRWNVFYLAMGLEKPSAPSDEFMNRFVGQQPHVLDVFFQVRYLNYA
jgi:hypothetical protein